MAISETPFANDSFGDFNRIRRITFMIGPAKTAAHVDNRSSGSVAAYDRARDDSTDPTNRHVVARDTYIDEEA